MRCDLASFINIGDGCLHIFQLGDCLLLSVLYACMNLNGDNPVFCQVPTVLGCSVTYWRLVNFSLLLGLVCKFLVFAYVSIMPSYCM